MKQVLRRAVAFTATLTASVPMAAQAQSVENNVPIVLTWNNEGGAPTGAAFDTRSGVKTFEKQNRRLVGSRSSSGQVVAHDISVNFKEFSVPLTVHTWAGDTRVQINTELWSVSCRPADVRRINAVNSSSGQTKIIGAIIAAHYIAEAVGTACPKPVRTKMRQKYFTLSCNLAKKVDFFGLSQDAMRAYAISKDTGQREAEACQRAVQGEAFRKLNGRLEQRMRKNDLSSDQIAQAREIKAALENLSTDPAWSEGAAQFDLDANTLAAYEAKLTYRESILASNDRNYAEALTLNQKLQGQLDDADGRRVLGKVSINERLLTEDAAFFTTRIDQAAAQEALNSAAATANIEQSGI